MSLLCCLGSMDGEKMNKAKQTLLYFLKSLPTDSYFNIISFGYDMSELFPGYVCEAFNHTLALNVQRIFLGIERLTLAYFVVCSCMALGYLLRIFCSCCNWNVVYSVDCCTVPCQPVCVLQRQPEVQLTDAGCGNAAAVQHGGWHGRHRDPAATPARVW